MDPTELAPIRHALETYYKLEKDRHGVIRT